LRLFPRCRRFYVFQLMATQTRIDGRRRVSRLGNKRAVKVGRIVSAIMFLLFAGFSFATVIVEFNVPFLVIGLGSLGFSMYTFVRTLRGDAHGNKKAEKPAEFDL